MTHLRKAIAVLLLCCHASAADLGDDLCPAAQATHKSVVFQGNWHDASTWQPQQVPPTGSQVLIQCNSIVTVEQNTADVRWIRVDGVLKACDHCDTQLNVHTLYVPMGGKLDYGSVGMPRTGKAVIEFTGGASLPGDWQKLSGGLICHGEFTAVGKEKTAWDVVDGDLAVGATSLTLLNVPFGWQAGDTILIAGTDSLVGEQQVKYQSEQRTITAINGRTVSWSQPLAYRHFRWRSDLPFHCANLTRNVMIRSRMPDVPNRGHCMFMSAETDLRYVAVESCGRTDKSVPVTDPRKDANGVLVPGSDANPRARYPIHWHRVGNLGPPASARGVVVNGSPGWGFVNHASNVQCDESICVNYFGSGFTTEEGQERGWYRRCLASGGRGQGDTIVSSDGDHGRPGIGDWGTDGSGFWLQGGMVEVSDCVSFDNSGRGFALFNRPLNGYPDFGSGNPIPAYLQFPIFADQSLLPVAYFQTPWWQYYVAHPPVQTSVPSQLVPQRVFSRNTAYGNKLGVQSWFGGGNIPQISSRLALPLSVRGSITDLTLWGRGGKLHCEYTRQFNIDGLTICGDQGFRNQFNTISAFSEAVLFRGDEMTLTRWDIQNMACKNFHIEGNPTPVNIQIENETVSGTTVTPN